MLLQGVGSGSKNPSCRACSQLYLCVMLLASDDFRKAEDFSGINVAAVSHMANGESFPTKGEILWSRQQ